MGCCCKCGKPTKTVACLGRCDIPRHACLECDIAHPKKPVPKNMGWHYTAKDSPEHQLRCGWRPGHIACSVLRRMQKQACAKSGCCANPCGPCGPCGSCGACGACGNCGACSSCGAPCGPPCGPSPCKPSPTCASTCGPPPSPKPCPPKPCPPPKSGCPPNSCPPIKCCPVAIWPPNISKPPLCSLPLIRIMRHKGEYSICTKPSNISNAPSGPNPLKYLLNTDDKEPTQARYSIEARFNDYQFDCTSSQASFVLDFSPPDKCCLPPYCKPGKSSKSICCMVCQSQDVWLPVGSKQDSNTQCSDVPTTLKNKLA